MDYLDPVPAERIGLGLLATARPQVEIHITFVKQEARHRTGWARVGAAIGTQKAAKYKESATNYQDYPVDSPDDVGLDGPKIQRERMSYGSMA
jgi:cysteine sulfinate desulfinase/cysteine desulfurase-like protein